MSNIICCCALRTTSLLAGRRIIYNVKSSEDPSQFDKYRTRSGSDGMLSRNLSLRSGRYRSRFCNVPSLGLRKYSNCPPPLSREISCCHYACNSMFRLSPNNQTVSIPSKAFYEHSEASALCDDFRDSYTWRSGAWPIVAARCNTSTTTLSHAVSGEEVPGEYSARSARYLDRAI